MRTVGLVQCCPADEPVSQCSVTQIDTAMLGRVILRVLLHVAFQHVS